MKIKKEKTIKDDNLEENVSKNSSETAITPKKKINEDKMIQDNNSLEVEILSQNLSQTTITPKKKRKCRSSSSNSSNSISSVDTKKKKKIKKEKNLKTNKEKIS